MSGLADNRSRQQNESVSLSAVPRQSLACALPDPAGERAVDEASDQGAQLVLSGARQNGRQKAHLQPGIVIEAQLVAEDAERQQRRPCDARWAPPQPVCSGLASMQPHIPNA